MRGNQEHRLDKMYKKLADLKQQLPVSSAYRNTVQWMADDIANLKGGTKAVFRETGDYYYGEEKGLLSFIEYQERYIQLIQTLSDQAIEFEIRPGIVDPTIMQLCREIHLYDQDGYAYIGMRMYKDAITIPRPIPYHFTIAQDWPKLPARNNLDWVVCKTCFEAVFTNPNHICDFCRSVYHA